MHSRLLPIATGRRRRRKGEEGGGGERVTKG